MGWVTLTLRKTELKRSHADYQMELLQISRTKRQMARHYHYEQSVLRNEQNSIMRQLRDDYDAEREYLNEGLSQANAAGGTIQNPNTGQTVTSSQLQNDLDEARLKYQEQVNQEKQRIEDEMALIEQEANDTETDLDQQQVEIEAQLEAISAEIEAVGEAISSQIQASTIKLS